MGFLKGRTNRATYWLAVGVCVLLYGAIYYFDGGHLSVSEVVLLIVAIPRLHDIGKSGWWAGGIFLAEFAVVGLALTLLPLEEARIATGIFTLMVAALMIWLGCIPGQTFANRFGEPPEPGFLWKQPTAKEN